MQFNGNETGQDLVGDTKFWITGSYNGTTDYGINDITRNSNRWYARAVSLAMRADGRWEFDDSNYTTLPVATTNLNSAQADYEITSGSFLDIERLEVKDENGNWIQLKPISYEDRQGTAMTEWAKTNGTPEYYDKVGNSMVLYPTPSYSSTAGLRVYFKRDASYFAVTDTTKEPGFNPQYHRIISMGAAYDYCLFAGMNNKLTTLNSEIAKMEEGLINFYSSRSKDEKVRMTVFHENYSCGEEDGGFINENVIY